MNNNEFCTMIVTIIVCILLSFLALALDMQGQTTKSNVGMEKLFRECEQWKKVQIHALNQTCQATIRTTCDNCRSFHLCGDNQVAYQEYVGLYPTACNDFEHSLSVDLGTIRCDDANEMAMEHLIAPLPIHCRPENPYSQTPMVCDCHYERRYWLTAWFGFSLPGNNTNHTKFIGFEYLSSVNPYVDSRCTTKTCLNKLYKEISEIAETLYVNSSDVTQQRDVHQFQKDYAKVLNERQEECVLVPVLQ